MTPLMLGMVGIAILVAMVMIRVPVAVALGLVGFGGYVALEGFGRAGLILASAPLELASAYGYSVVPLFTLMGAVAAVSGLSSDLFRAAEAALRGARGSSGVAAIMASALFSAISGSSVATALTMSRVSIPEMRAQGYPATLAAGAVAAGGTLGILIPPSLILMIYAIIAQLSIAELFAAALIPGLVLTVLYMAVAFLLGRRHAPEAPANRPAFLPAMARIWHVVLLFTGTIGGIYIGWFTPTEAAAVGALGAILLVLVTRRVTFALLGKTTLDTARLVSTAIFIVMASAVFSYFIVQTGLSDALARGMKASGYGPLGVILLICLAYVVMGCFLDGIAMILITVPILLPLVLSYGIDPVWFGVLLVVLIEIGLVTPPFGMNIFVIKAVSRDLSVIDIYRGAMSFLPAPLVLIALMIAWPDMVLWLPSLLK
ncbi:TRAP transporter large permease [Gemmobacter sp.]|uniref:TRAP transporter large permease n=1 Tax=Gemmobacter sp. TaxID=1898957 RepID=UPI002B00377F|nr:TRAP transporter large permease [Gemmobacter sp.]